MEPITTFNILFNRLFDWTTWIPLPGPKLNYSLPAYYTIKTFEPLEICVNGKITGLILDLKFRTEIKSIGGFYYPTIGW